MVSTKILNSTTFSFYNITVLLYVRSNLIPKHYKKSFRPLSVQDVPSDMFSVLSNKSEKCFFQMHFTKENAELMSKSINFSMTLAFIYLADISNLSN